MAPTRPLSRFHATTTYLPKSRARVKPTPLPREVEASSNCPHARPRTPRCALAGVQTFSHLREVPPTKSLAGSAAARPGPARRALWHGSAAAWSGLAAARPGWRFGGDASHGGLHTNPLHGSLLIFCGSSASKSVLKHWYNLQDRRATGCHVKTYSIKEINRHSSELHPLKGLVGVPPIWMYLGTAAP